MWSRWTVLGSWESASQRTSHGHLTSPPWLRQLRNRAVESILTGKLQTGPGQEGSVGGTPDLSFGCETRQLICRTPSILILLFSSMKGLQLAFRVAEWKINEPLKNISIAQSVSAVFTGGCSSSTHVFKHFSESRIKLLTIAQHTETNVVVCMLCLGAEFRSAVRLTTTEEEELWLSLNISEVKWTEELHGALCWLQEWCQDQRHKVEQHHSSLHVHFLFDHHRLLTLTTWLYL